MTPKEKAKELVGQFSWIDCSSDAKQCALICVDEIISIPSIQAAYAQGYSNSKSTESYWREVKQELLKL